MQRTVCANVVAYSLLHVTAHITSFPPTLFILTLITSFIFRDLEITSPPTLLLSFLFDNAVQNLSSDIHGGTTYLHVSSLGFNAYFLLLKFSWCFFLHPCLAILRLFLMCSHRHMRMKPDKNKLQLVVQAVTRKLQQICWVLALILSKQTSLLRVHPS